MQMKSVCMQGWNKEEDENLFGVCWREDKLRDINYFLSESVAITLFVLSIKDF